MSSGYKVSQDCQDCMSHENKITGTVGKILCVLSQWRPFSGQQVGYWILDYVSHISCMVEWRKLVGNILKWHVINLCTSTRSAGTNTLIKVSFDV